MNGTIWVCILNVTGLSQKAVYRTYKPDIVMSAAITVTTTITSTTNDACVYIAETHSETYNRGMLHLELRTEIQHVTF